MHAQVYKILRREEAEAMDATGRFEGSADDRRDGFIHLSSAEQVHATLERHYSAVSNALLLECSIPDTDPALRWEPSRGGALFPHLYRALVTSDVRARASVPEQRASLVLPLRPDD